MAEFVEQPLWPGNHYVAAAVSGSVSQFIAISGSSRENFPARAVSIYRDLITIKRLTTRAIGLIKDAAGNEASRYRA